jgi:hypothetical protein
MTRSVHKTGLKLKQSDPKFNFKSFCTLIAQGKIVHNDNDAADEEEDLVQTAENVSVVQAGEMQIDSDNTDSNVDRQ